MKLGLVLSNDWELFGNGTGDYFEIQHHPLQQLLGAVEDHGAQLTVMAEIGQQWAHQRLGEKEAWAQDIALAWESSLRDTIRRGSDVQLHLHPQWLRASYQPPQWLLDARRISITSLSDTEMATVLAKGKRELETLLCPVHPDYECLAFRSGWYCMQPSHAVTKNLLNAGFVCDTSVVPGAVKPRLYDYRGAHSTYQPWFVRDDDIQYASDVPTGLLEIPIHAVETVRWPLLNRLFGLRLANFLSFGVMTHQADVRWARQRNVWDRQLRLAGGKSILEASQQRSWRETLKRALSHLVMEKTCVRLDYDNLSPSVFVNCLQRILDAHREKSPKQDEQVIIPIVATGHVKRMLNCDNINRTLELVNRQLKDRVMYWTLRDAVRSSLSCTRGAHDPTL